MIIDHLGSLDILVNNAAFVGTSRLEGWTVPFLEQLPATWRSALDINLTAPFILTQSCVPLLRDSGHGSIINVGSIYGMVGPNLSLYRDTDMGNPAAYAASKGGLLQLTRWLATVLAPHIRVNALTPGGIARNQPPAFVERYETLTPLARMATEEDFKGAIAFLASDLSAYVTGQNLVVDGGWTAW
jgi:NAD(P)-dependent dehydrogenase (short-subunit alcohol dehydrogenase family)